MICTQANTKIVREQLSWHLIYIVDYWQFCLEYYAESSNINTVENIVKIFLTKSWSILLAWRSTK